MISTSSQITNMHEFITKDNLDKIENTNFKIDDYYSILKEIYDEGMDNLEFEENFTILDKIKKITNQHVNIYYSEKEIGSGYYIYNKIYLNNELPQSQQIVTLIHELSHHIYAEIFEKWLDKIFDVENYSIIESFVMFMLNNSIENRVADEYMSYILEGRFTPKKYQNYISFIQLLIESQIDVEKSKDFFIFAHEMSHDIDKILRPMITDELVNEIEEQFVKDDIVELDQELKFDYYNERFDDLEKVEIIKEMIYFIFDYFVNGEGNINDLESYIENFDNKLKD